MAKAKKAAKGGGKARPVKGKPWKPRPIQVSTTQETVPGGAKVTDTHSL